MSTEKDRFARDKNNPGAVLNVDNAALKAYKLKKAKDKEIQTLKDEVKEIKYMLSKIIEKLN